MMFRPVNETRVCNNPCKNGGTCKYVAATNGYICVCSSDICGNNCEFVRPCENGTCVYDNATNTSAWEGCVDVLPDATTDGATEDTRVMLNKSVLNYYSHFSSLFPDFFSKIT